MKRLGCSAAARTAAVMLSALMLILTIASAAGCVFCFWSEMYTKTYEDVLSERITAAVREQIMNVYFDHINSYDIYEVSDSIFYSAQDISGNEVLTNCDGGFAELDKSGMYRMSFTFNEDSEKYMRKFDVCVSLDGNAKDNENDGIRIYADLIEYMYSVKYRVMVLAVIFAILTVIFYVFAVNSAGCRKDTEGAVRGWFDKIPFDVLIVLALFAAVLELMGISAFADFVSYSTEWTMYYALIILVAGCVFFDSMLITLLSMSFVVRLKTGTFISNNFSVYIVKVLWRWIKKLVSGVVGAFVKAAKLVYRIIYDIPVFYRGAIFWCVAVPVFALVNGVLVKMSKYDGFWDIFIFLLWLAAIALGVYRSWNLSRIKTGSGKLAEGKLDEKISTEYLSFDYRETAKNLNRVGDGIALAVEEKMKGERFKTELITNVSHDIKTPITSIINYIDLLKKTNIEDETALEYISVLERQSERLKKLTVDLIEASKASSGVIEVAPELMELGIFLSQASGEYSERMKKNELTLITSFPEEKINVYADGKLMWRVIDNLMSNACKYSLPGTRVYLSLSKSGREAVITLNNISREAINYSGDELTERFVRGDMSRHTEGSGLGLSIAKSLVELQGGRLIIFTDSDLFKVTVRIKLADWGSISVSEEEKEKGTEHEECAADAEMSDGSEPDSDNIIK